MIREGIEVEIKEDGRTCDGRTGVVEVVVLLPVHAEGRTLKLPPAVPAKDRQSTTSIALAKCTRHKPQQLHKDRCLMSDARPLTSYRKALSSTPPGKPRV